MSINRESDFVYLSSEYRNQKRNILQQKALKILPVISSLSEKVEMIDSFQLKINGYGFKSGLTENQVTLSGTDVLIKVLEAQINQLKVQIHSTLINYIIPKVTDQTMFDILNKQDSVFISGTGLFHTKYDLRGITSQYPDCNIFRNEIISESLILKDRIIQNGIYSQPDYFDEIDSQYGQYFRAGIYQLEIRIDDSYAYFENDAYSNIIANIGQIPIIDTPPLSYQSGEIINIIGKGFSSNLLLYAIQFCDIVCKVVSSNLNNLKFIVPKLQTSYLHHLCIELNYNKLKKIKIYYSTDNQNWKQLYELKYINKGWNALIPQTQIDQIRSINKSRQTQNETPRISLILTKRVSIFHLTKILLDRHLSSLRYRDIYNSYRITTLTKNLQGDGIKPYSKKFEHYYHITIFTADTKIELKDYGLRNTNLQQYDQEIWRK